MLKYADVAVTFSEFPKDIALCINISGCPNHCPGCHSNYLAEDIGEKLNTESLKTLIDNNIGITCVGFMGGDQNPLMIAKLADFVKANYDLKIGWYSGKEKLPKDMPLDSFDYYKIGPYKEECGPLSSPTTNQRFYSRGKHLHKSDVKDNVFYDVTN